MNLQQPVGRLQCLRWQGTRKQTRSFMKPGRWEELELESFSGFTAPSFPPVTTTSSLKWCSHCNSVRLASATKQTTCLKRCPSISTLATLHIETLRWLSRNLRALLTLLKGRNGRSAKTEGKSHLTSSSKLCVSGKSRQSEHAEETLKMGLTLAQ